MSIRSFLHTAAAFALSGLLLSPGSALQAVVLHPASVHAFYQAAAPQIYSDTANAKADIQAALVTARKYHRNVILDFGADWCGDCKVLDIYLRQSPNLELVQSSFVVVHINVGRYDKNLDLARQYDIPLQKGVPALAVLNPHGRLLYSQRTGQFEDMRHMSPGAVTEFLQKWRPAPAGKKS